MKRFFYLLSAAVLIIAVFLVVRPRQVTVESLVLHRGPFSETLSLEGKVRSRNKQTVFAAATGSIDSLQIKEGETVKKGQIVSKLEWDKTLQVKSPLDGVVSKIFRDSAGPVVRGEPLFEVSDISNLEVVVDLLTQEAVRLSSGGEATILNWGGPGSLQAKVFQISRAGAVKISALGVEEERTEVKLSFEKVPVELKNKFGDNYHVDVVFVISHDANVLTVPLGALFKSDKKWAVYLIQDGRAHLREISISKKNDQQAIVSEGLSENDRVVLFPGDKIHEGTRVQ